MQDHALHLATEPAAGAHGGDRALEFDLFFEQERARLFQALCLVTRNRFEAEELAQDAFLAVYEHWDRVRDMVDPTGYLYRTAMNAFRSWHRRSALAAKRAIGLTRVVGQTGQHDGDVSRAGCLPEDGSVIVVLIGHVADHIGVLAEPPVDAVTG